MQQFCINSVSIIFFLISIKSKTKYSLKLEIGPTIAKFGHMKFKYSFLLLNKYLFENNFSKLFA